MPTLSNKYSEGAENILQFCWVFAHPCLAFLIKFVTSNSGVKKCTTVKASLIQHDECQDSFALFFIPYNVHPSWVLWMQRSNHSKGPDGLIRFNRLFWFRLQISQYSSSLLASFPFVPHFALQNIARSSLSMDYQYDMMCQWITYLYLQMKSFATAASSPPPPLFLKHCELKYWSCKWLVCFFAQSSSTSLLEE